MSHCLETLAKLDERAVLLILPMQATPSSASDPRLFKSIGVFHLLDSPSPLGDSVLCSRGRLPGYRSLSLIQIDIPRNVEPGKVLSGPQGSSGFRKGAGVHTGLPGFRAPGLPGMETRETKIPSLVRLKDFRYYLEVQGLYAAPWCCCFEDHRLCIPQVSGPELLQDGND